MPNYGGGGTPPLRPPKDYIDRNVVPRTYDDIGAVDEILASPEKIAAPLRPLETVTVFKAFYHTLAKASHGDYKLVLGIPFDQKDSAWKLSDYDGAMVEITIRARAKTIPGVGEVD